MLGDEKSALFVIISDTDTTFNFIVAIMYSKMFNLLLFILCDEYDVDPKLMLAVIQIESNYVSDVISYGNYGLCQINKINHKWLGNLLGITDWLDPVQNMTAGGYLYSVYLNQTDGNIHMAAMKYQIGEAGAKRRFDCGIYESYYSRKLIFVMESLKLE